MPKETVVTVSEVLTIHVYKGHAGFMWACDQHFGLLGYEKVPAAAQRHDGTGDAGHSDGVWRQHGDAGFKARCGSKSDD